MQNSKRKTFGKLLVVALFVMLFALVLTVSVGAEATTHNVATETELTTALTDATDGDTINVTADITLTSGITVSKKLTFEGNGHTISTSEADTLVAVASDVTFNNMSLSNTKAGSHLFAVWKNTTGSITITGTGAYSTTDRLIHVNGKATVSISGSDASAPISLSAKDILRVETDADVSGDLTATLGANVTANATDHMAYFSGNTKGNVTLDGATVNTDGKGFELFDSAAANLTVNSGSLITKHYIICTQGTSTSTITLNDGKIQNTNNQGIVNWSTGKIDFIMTDGEYNNDHSSNANEELFWYDQENTKANTIRITGGKVVGGYFNIFGSSNTNIEIGGTAEIEFVDGKEGLSYQGSSKGDVKINGSAKITNTGNVVTYKDSATGLVTIGGSADLSGNQIALEGSGKIDLTISGTPIISLTSGYNGINHKSTGGGTLTLSGTWSTNKTIYFTGGKKIVKIEGADTNITVGGSGFYANGCEMEFTMLEGTFNATNNLIFFLSKASGSATIGGSAKCYFTKGCGIEISDASPTVTIQGSAQIISNATAGDKEVFNITNGACPTIYVKENAKIETPNNMWGHIFRVGTDAAADAPANATIYVQGSTIAGEKGVDLDGHRILDTRSRSSATFEVSGKVDLNADAGIVKANELTNTVDIKLSGNDISMTVGNDTAFQIRAKAASFTLDGKFEFDCNAKTFLYFKVFDPEQNYKDEAKTQLRNVVSITGDLTLTNCYRFLEFWGNSNEMLIDVDLVGIFNTTVSNSTFYVEGTTGLVDIDVTPRKGNTIDTFTANAWRLINFRENTVVDLSITTNEIDVTTTERTSYCVGCTDIDLTFKADTIAFTTGAGGDSDCYFTFNNYPSEQANVNLDGNISFTNTSIGTDTEKSVRYFGHWGGGTVLVGLTMRNMEINSSNAALLFDNEASFPNGIVFDNCSGILEIAGTLTAPQIHVKGGSMATVITGTANLSGLGNGTMQGGLLYSNGATGSITISGSGVLNHKNGHGIEINGCSNTVTVKDTGSIISAATANDRECIYVVNGANATIYAQDNATFFSPDGKWGHAFRVGDSDGKAPATATIYVQGSTAEGDEGIDMDVSRVLDIRKQSSATIDISGRVDLNTDASCLSAHTTAKLFNAHIHDDEIKFTNGDENLFKIYAENATFIWEGDYTEAVKNAAHFIDIGGSSTDPNAKRTVTLIGNFNLTTDGDTVASASCFFVCGNIPVEINVKPREGSTTDKFVFNGGRLFNIRENSDATLKIETNKIDVTCVERLGYTISSAQVNVTLDGPVSNYNTSATDAFILCNGGNDGDVSITFKGNVNITTAGANFFSVNNSNDVTLAFEGSLNTAYVDNLIWCSGKDEKTITGKVTLDIDCTTLSLTGKRIADITSAGSLDFDIKATSGTVTGSNEETDIGLFKLEGITGTGSTIDIDGGFTATGYKIISITAGSVATTIGGNVTLTATHNSVHYSGSAAGSVTITGSASISGIQILLEGSGKIDLTISGTPTIVTTSKYNGICHKATGDAIINLSGVWSTNKTIYFTGGKKTVSVTGTDTVLTIGGSGFYAIGASCELNITVDDATINGTGGEGVFTATGDEDNGTATVNVTINSGNVSNSNNFFGRAHKGGTLNITIEGGTLSANNMFFKISGGATGNLTVNGGQLSSGSYFSEYNDTASGSVTYAGGTIRVKDHNLVNFGSGKVDFTMTDGTVNAPNSLVWYENKDTNAATESSVKISGGTATGGYMNIFKTAAADITIEGDAIVNITGKEGRAIYYHDSAKGDVTVGGNAKVTITGGWVFTFVNTASGSVTLKGNAVVTGNEHGFVNNGSAKADFTIQDNASFTITKYTTIYYGGTFPANVVNNINIKGGSITGSGSDNAITFPGSGEFVINISGGTVTSNSNAIYIGSDKTNPSKFTVNVSGGIITSNSNDGMEVVARDTITVNMTVSGGTFHGKHMDLTNGSGYPLQFWGKNNTLTVTGGNFIADYAHAAMMVAGGATANVYGGYLEAGALCCTRATEGGTLNIYGGTFYYTGTTNSGGMPVRSGTGSAVGNVNIYGGYYYTEGTGTIFCCMNGVSNLTLHGGFNAWGGRGLVESANTASIASSGHGIGDMWTYRSIQMTTGAAVRIVEGSTGLRFKGIISAADYAHIASIADAGSISFGTVIAPADYAKQVKFFTKETLKAAKLTYLDIPASNGLHEMEDGSYEIWAALTNIKEENLDREFAAVCYVTYTVNGEAVTTYATYREVKNARSIRQVARLALQDDGRYNSNQIAVLQTLAPTGKAPVIDLYLIAGQSNAAGSTKFGEDFRNSNQNFIDGYSNIYYSGTAAGGTSFASKNFVEVELVKAGYGGNKISGMGAELGMAKALSQYYNPETGRTAAIVKYGYGGTALADTISGQNFPEGSWAPPSWLAENGKKDEYKSGGLYRAFVKQIESSISDYRAMGYDVNIVAAYWMQGESDRGNPDRYAQMFEMWVNDLRADVYALTGDSADQKLPILVGEISYSYNPGDMQLNPAFIAMQNALADSIENLYVINQSPLATANTRSDTGHWSCDDMLLIGEMVATTALNELVLGANATKYEMPYLTGTPVAEVYDAEGSLIGTYSSFSWAINTAPAGATVKLLSDLTIYGPLGINNPNRITVDGQNYKIDVKTTEGDAMKLVATDVVLKDFNIKNHSTAEWGMQTYRNAKFIWNGGSFEAESIGIVMNDTSVGQLHNVTVSVRNGVEGHSAAIYMGGNNADIWVDNCTVTAYGKAEAIRAINGYITVSGNSVITGGTDTAYAVSQRSIDGYLSVDKDVVINGTVQNKGFGSFMNEDAVDLPTPAAPVDPAA